MGSGEREANPLVLIAFVFNGALGRWCNKNVRQGRRSSLQLIVLNGILAHHVAVGVDGYGRSGGNNYFYFKGLVIGVFLFAGIFYLAG